jgi:hypothetical protein
VTVDFKQPRITEDREGWEDLRRTKLGPCRVTGSVFNVTMFHLVGRDLGGDDVPDNLIPICQDVHMEWEHAPDGKQKWGPSIWATLTASEQRYVLEKKGPFFARRYYGVDL